MGRLKGSHAGHRQRMRDKIKANGICSLNTIELIEYILYFGVPYRDTRVMAEELLFKFGNVYNISHAPEEEILEISGITKNAAMLLRTLPEILEAYADSSVKGLRIDTSVKAVAYFKEIFKGMDEICYIMCLDEEDYSLGLTLVATGTYEHVKVSLEKIKDGCIKSKAKRVIIAHNHPSGDVMPSDEDYISTARLREALHDIDVLLVDHVIIHKTRSYSMRSGLCYEY